MTDRIAVVGAGQMGNGIAHVFAQSGFQVTMIDVSQEALDNGRSTIAKNIERQVKKGTIPAEDQVKILSRIDLNMDLEAAGNASLIIEAASEDAGLKYRIFTDLDRIAKPKAVLATNTSSISITEIARPSTCFANPARAAAPASSSLSRLSRENPACCPNRTTMPSARSSAAR
jgi:3-hydroxybutyryl-CoA dehydrogenase